MKRFFLLTIILTVVMAGKVGAQDASSASKRANQQYVLFESERDKGTNVTAMYDYLLDSYANFMKVVEAPNNGQYIGGAKSRLKALHTTYAHTGAMVNLYAMGVGAEKFGGVYDNTEVFHKLAELTSVQ